MRRSPTVIQMEAVECGAACLGMILGYHGRYVPLEQLRLECGVSRDGSNALNLIKAARAYGLEGQGKKTPAAELKKLTAPFIILWEYNHFVVVDGFDKHHVHVNDPACGPRTLTFEEFEEAYSGIVLTFTKTEAFQASGKRPSLTKELFERLVSVRTPLLYLLLAGLCLLLPGLALPAFTRLFVDTLDVASMRGWKEIFFISLLLVALVGGLLTWLQHYYLNRLNSRLAIGFSGHFIWHILRLPIMFYMQRFSGEIAYRTTLNTTVAQQMTGSLATTCIDTLLVVFYGIVMLSYDLVVGLTAFAAGLIILGVFLWVQRSRGDAYARKQHELGKWIGNTIGSLQQIETIKAIGLENDAFTRHAGYTTKNLNAQQEISKKDAWLSTTPVACQALAFVAILSVGTWRLLEGHLSYGMFLALQTLLIGFLTPITRFVNFGQTMQTIRTDITRLNDVLKNPIDPIYEKREKRSTTSKLKLDGKLEFRDVTFGYSPLAEPLLKGLSFTLNPGERVALVGPSGCGKSTIAKLACGLLQPWEGEVLYDGVPLHEIPAETFYHSIGYVDQEIFLFSGTVRENLTLWNPAVDEQMLLKAAEDSAIHEEVLLRKGGYEYLLAEGGKNLSGGQRQRMEIARALVYAPSLLIMDEATSALDSETEKTISDNTRRRGCSALMIAHRLSTIRDCDEILVLDRGKLVERGTHTSLKQKHGLYAQLVEESHG